MLVIVKHWNVHALTQAPFNLKTFRCLDVFQVDAAKGGLKACDDVDKLFDSGFSHLNVKDVNARKFLEQNRLAFHHGFCSQRPYVAKAQYRRAVGNHRNQIGARRIECSIGRIVTYGLRNRGNSR